MIRFDLVAELVVDSSTASSAPAIPTVIEPVDTRLAAYRARNDRFHAARRLPGFSGYSLRPGCDVVIDAQHVALTPRLFGDHA